MNLADEKAAVKLLQAASRIESEEELRNFPLRIRETYNLKHVAYAATGIGFSELLYVAGTYPQEWIVFWCGASCHDPIVKAAAQGRPVVWESVDPHDEFEKLMMNRRRQMIGRQAITFPILSSDESTGLISFVGDDSKDDWNKQVAVLVRELRQVGLALHRSALRTMGITPQEIKISARHVNILQLLAAGMNEEQIGRFLEISERTVKQHISEAKTRLRCRTKAQLVAVAIGQGYLKLQS